MKALRLLLALGVSAGGLWFALKGVDWASLAASLKSIRSPFWLLIFPLASGVEFFFRTWRWTVLLRPIRPASFRSFFPITAATFFMNNVLPFRAGEWARIYWTRRRTNVAISTAFSIFFVDRIFDMVCLLTIVAAVLSRKSGLVDGPGATALFAAVTLAGFAGIVFLARFPEKTIQWARKARVPAKGLLLLAQFAEGAKALRSPWVLLKTYLISISFWVIGIGVIWGVAPLFGLPLSPLDTGWLVVGFCLGALLPSAPGYVGVFEAAGVTALGLLGYAKAETLPFVLVVHFSQILSTALWGVPCLLLTDLSVGETRRGALDPSLESAPS